MALTPRKEKILTAVINSYVDTGIPVGSKALLDSLDFSVSSATVRNEMAELAELGYLEQPHTSAGRIPSNLGYRYYIDHLLNIKQPTTKEKEHIKARLTAAADDPEHIINEASYILSSLLPVASVITTPPGDESTIQRIRLVQTGRQTSMVVLITSAGMVKTRLFRCDFLLTSELLQVFETALNQKLSGVGLNQFSPAFIQNLAISFGELALLMPNVLMGIMDAAKDASATNVCISGQTNLLLTPEFDLMSVRNIFSFLSRKSDISKLLLQCTDKTKMIIGTESNIYELEKTGVIINRYNIANQPAGAVAIIGSTRINYSVATGYVEYISNLVGKLINELLDYTP